MLRAFPKIRKHNQVSIACHTKCRIIKNLNQPKTITEPIKAGGRGGLLSLGGGRVTVLGACFVAQVALHGVVQGLGPPGVVLGAHVSRHH